MMSDCVSDLPSEMIALLMFLIIFSTHSTVSRVLKSSLASRGPMNVTVFSIDITAALCTPVKITSRLLLASRHLIYNNKYGAMLLQFRKSYAIEYSPIAVNSLYVVAALDGGK